MQIKETYKALFRCSFYILACRFASANEAEKSTYYPFLKFYVLIYLICIFAVNSLKIKVMMKWELKSFLHC